MSLAGATGAIASAAVVQPPYPDNLPQTDLVLAARADLNVTLATTLRRSGGIAGTVTLSGDRTEASPMFVSIYAGGALGVMTFFLSLDANPGTPTTSTPILSPVGGVYAVPGTARILTFSAASYLVGTTFESEVESVVDCTANGWVIAFAANKRPVLDGSAVGGKRSFHVFGAQIGKCTDAALATALAGGTNQPNELFSAARLNTATSPAGTQIFCGMSNSAGQALTRIYMDGATRQFRSGRRQNAGGTVVTPTSSGTLAAHVTYRLRSSFPGTTHTLEQNGVVVMNAQPEVAGGPLTLNELTLFASNVNGSEGNFMADGYIPEIVGYSSNDPARDAPVLSYLDVRYPELVSAALAANKFWDTAAPASVGNIPNDYPDGDVYDRVICDVPLGTMALHVYAVQPIPNGSFRFDTVAAFDESGALLGELTYASMYGVESVQTLALDGAAHTITLVARVKIRRLLGATAQDVVFVAKRLLSEGDSISLGSLSTDPYTIGWQQSMRDAAGLGPDWGLTFIGRSGRKLSEIASSSTLIDAWVNEQMLPRLTGTAANLVMIALGINDKNANQLAATFQTQYMNLLTAATAAAPVGTLFILQSLIGNVNEGPNGAGSTCPDFRAATLATATAFGATYIDGFAALPYNSSEPTPGAKFVDGIHPNDIGSVQIRAYAQPIIAAAAP